MFQSGNGTDYLAVRAYDGTAWSAWTDFHVIAPTRQPPVVNVADQSVVAGSSTYVSTMFSVTDSYTSTMTDYHIFDGTADASSGHFVLLGNAIAANTVTDVTPLNMAGLSFLAGTTSDYVAIQAFDGTAWSAWTAFHINPHAYKPVITPTNYVAHVNEIVPFVSLFQINGLTDLGLSNISYQVYDATTDQGSGHFALLGATDSPFAAKQTVFSVGGVIKPSIVYVGGAVPEYVAVRAYDSTANAYSDWTAFHIAPPVPPVIHASDTTIAHNGSVALSSLFTVTDANNYAITQYQFYQANTNSDAGKLLLGGTAQAAATVVPIFATPTLATATFQAGSGTDFVALRAYDGTNWSSWQAFHIAAPLNNAPVVTVTDHTLAAGTDTLMSTLFSVRDAEGDAIQAYQFYDSTAAANSGHFTLAGTAQAANTIINATAAQLASLTFHAGTVPDYVAMRAFDGLDWSAWNAFHL